MRWMKPLVSLLLFGGLILPVPVLSQAPTAEDLNLGLRVSVDSPNETSILSWWGNFENAYFIQVTSDLTADWNYIDQIYSGRHDAISHIFSSNTSALFFRVTHIPYSGFNPEYEDFDGDGVSNIDELALGTNPFLNIDSDGDGMPDNWEISYGLDPNDPSDADEDPDGDGLTNIQEFLSKQNPFEHKDNPSAVPLAPEGITIKIHADGSRTYSWIDRSDNEDYFFIEMVGPDGNLVRIADQIPPNTTTYTVSAAAIQAALSE